MEIKDIEVALEGILFAAGEPVSGKRIAEVLDIDIDTVFSVAQQISDKFSFERRGIRLIRLEDSLQLASAPEAAHYIRLALETRKAPQLSPPALEVLSIIAYFQPATRAYVEQIRGVDSSYTVGILHERGLIEPCGRLQVPGRPVLFRTTKTFLRSFGLSSLDELPEIPDLEENTEGQMKLKTAIEALRATDETEVQPET